MSSAKITLLGFYKWMEEAGDDLFKAFDDLPAGVDKDDLVSNILLRGGEFEVLYSDPVFMQAAIGPWLRKWQRTIEKWVTALSIKYDPLFNYDRTEEYTDTTDRGKLNSENVTRGLSEDIGRASSAVMTTDSTGSEDHSGNVTTENEKSAFDSSTYSPKDKSTVTDGSGIDTANHSTSVNGTNDTENRSQDETQARSGMENESTTMTHSARMYGNIGVTTTQKLMREEMEVARFNLIDEITDLFLPEFIIPVYN